MEIINLTQHQASADQIAEGVFDLDPNEISKLKELLTFTSLPTADEIQHRAHLITIIAKLHFVEYAMIGGAGYLIPALEAELRKNGITPLHAFSERVSVEHTNDQGGVVKTNVFKHVGFIETK